MAYDKDKVNEYLRDYAERKGITINKVYGSASKKNEGSLDNEKVNEYIQDYADRKGIDLNRTDFSTSTAAQAARTSTTVTPRTDTEENKSALRGAEARFARASDWLARAATYDPYGGAEQYALEMLNKRRQAQETAESLRSQLNQPMELEETSEARAARAQAIEARQQYEDFTKKYVDQYGPMLNEDGALMTDEEIRRRTDELKSAWEGYENEYEQARKAPYDKLVGLAELNDQLSDAYLNNYYKAIPYYSDFSSRQEDPYTHVSDEEYIERYFNNDWSREDEKQYLMTDEELKIATYLKNTQGASAAREYINQLQLDERVMENYAQNAYEFGQDHPVVASGISVVQNLGNAVRGGAYVLGNAVSKLMGNAQEIDPYDEAFEMGVVRDAERAGVTSDMNGVGNFLYQTGMSTLDSALIGSFGPVAGAALMGTGALTDTVRDVKERGGTDEQALKMGIIAGAAEIVTEYAGFERLAGLIGGKSQAVLVDVVRNMASEFGEEAATEIINIVADLLIMADESEFRESVARYMRDVDDEKEAVRLAVIDSAKQVGLAGLGGAVSGGVLGGSAAAIGTTGQQVNDYIGNRKEKKSARLVEQLANEVAQYEAYSDTEQQAQGNAQATPSQLAEQAARATEDQQKATEVGLNPNEAMAGALDETRETGAQAAQEATGRSEKAEKREETAATSSTKAEAADTPKQTQAMQEKATTREAAYQANYEGGDKQEYSRAFDALYRMGEANLPLEAALRAGGEVTKNISIEARARIWQAGQDHAIQTITPGVNRQHTQTLERTQRAQLRVLDELGKRYGLEVMTVDSLNGVNGLYAGGRRLVVALDALDQAYVQTAGHEMVHYVRQMSEEGYRVLEQAILDELGDQETIDGMIDLRMKEYERAGRQISRDQAMEEIVAESVPVIFTSKEAVRTLVQRDRTLAEKIRDFIIDFVDTLKKIAGRYSADSNHSEMALLSGDEEKLTRIAQMFDDALESVKPTDIDTKAPADLEQNVTLRADDATADAENRVAASLADKINGKEDEDTQKTKFSLNPSSPVDAALAEDQSMIAPKDVNVNPASVRLAARKALNEGIKTSTEQKLNQLAGRLIKDTGSKYNRKELARNLNALMAEYAENGPSDQTTKAVADMAKAMIEASTRVDDTLIQQYADLSKKLKNTQISLTNVQKQEVANVYGDVQSYKKLLGNTTRITDDGVSLDSVWGELSQMHPEIFHPETNEAQMPDALLVFSSMMKPRYVNSYGMDVDQAAIDLGLRIHADVVGIAGMNDAARMYMNQVNQMRAQYKADLRKQEVALKKERVERFQQIADELKEARATGNFDEQRKVMSRYKSALRKEGVDTQGLIDAKLYQERLSRDTLRRHIDAKTSKLMTRMVRPKKGEAVPTMMQSVVLDVLEMLDVNGPNAAIKGVETKAAAVYRKSLNALKEYYEGIWRSQSRGDAAPGMDGLMMSVSERNINEIRDAVDAIASGDKLVLRDMSNDQLRAVNELLTQVTHSIDSIGRLWKARRYQNVKDLGEASMAEMDARPALKLTQQSGVKGAATAASDFMSLDLADPITYGERLGEAGGEVIQELMRGESDKWQVIHDSQDAIARMMEEEKFSGYDIGRWRNEYKTITLGSGKEIKMSDVQIMDLYNAARRPQGLKHILGDGISVQKSDATGVQNHIQVTAQDVGTITSKLTDQQRRVAKRLQEFLAIDMAKRGNDVTQRMYLYDAFTELTYWPLTSDPNMLATQEPSADRSLSGILNSGFTKPLEEKARNPVVVRDAFAVFDQHVAEMANYVGLAEPISDALSYLNYKSRGADGVLNGSVKESMQRALGDGGVKYMVNLLGDLNQARRGADSMPLSKLVGNFKRSQVVAKIRVVIQQPGSIVRVAQDMSPIYVVKGLKPDAGALQEMHKYSSLAWWKSNGNYDVGTGRGLESILWGDTTKFKTAERFAETGGGLIDAGKADDFAWVRMWTAAKREVEAKYKKSGTDVDVKSDAFLKEVAERFDEVVNRTQVVDTIMHRAQVMRSNNAVVKSMTAFRSEPIKTYNMMMRATMDAYRNPGAKTFKTLARAAVVYTANAALQATATALFDTFKHRDDDDPIWEYLLNGHFWNDYSEEWTKAFMDDLNLLNAIPIIGDVLNLASGSSTGMMEMEGLQAIIESVQGSWDYFFNGNTKGKTLYGALSPVLHAVSKVTGLPISGYMNNIEALVNIFDPKILSKRAETATFAGAYSALYQAMKAGDDKKAANLRAQLASGIHGKSARSAKEIDAGIADALAMDDERVKKCYDLREDGGHTQELTALKKEIMADGFSDAIVTRAINRCESLYYGKQEEEASEKDLSEQLVAAMYDYDALNRTIREGSADDVEVVATYLMEHSSAADPQKAIRSQAVKEFKAEYVDLARSGKQKEAMELAEKLSSAGVDESDLASWVKEDYRSDVKELIGQGDASAARALADELMEKYDDVAQSSLTSSITDAFKQKYIDMVVSGDESGADALAETLQSLDFRNSNGNVYRQTVLNGWVTAWEKKQE